MFKAKLIADKSFYQLKRKQALLSLVVVLPVVLIFIFFEVANSTMTILLALYLLIIFLQFRMQKKLDPLLGSKLVEMDGEQIRVKSKKGAVLEIIELKEVNEIVLKDTYSVNNDLNVNMGDDLMGNVQQNYLIVRAGNGEKRLDFEVDSHYMAARLDKVIDEWHVRGYSIVSTEVPLLTVTSTA